MELRMVTVLWVAQVALALLFVGVGALKSFGSPAGLAARLKTFGDVPLWQVRAIGIVEILGGLGVLLPTATGLLPWLAPLAAGGLVLMMAAAGGAHFVRGEQSRLPINALILVVAAFVAYGRN
jgi:DoxX-like family